MRMLAIAIAAVLLASCQPASTPNSPTTGAQVDLLPAKQAISSELQKRFVHCPDGYYSNSGLGFWNEANHIAVRLSPSGVSEADGLNGIQQRVNFEITCGARRSVSSTGPSSWGDCRESLRPMASGQVTERSGAWSLENAEGAFDLLAPLPPNYPSPCPGNESALGTDIFQ